MMARQADMAASRDTALNLVVMASIAGTYSLIEVDSTTGKMSRLALTEAQRDEILHDLQSAFGDKITGGMKADQYPVTVAAAALYQVISNPGYKLRKPK